MTSTSLPTARSSASGVSKRIPLRDFFRNSEYLGYGLSPDGKWIAFLQPYERRLNIYVQSLDAVLSGNGEPRRVTNSLDRDIRQYFWKGNDTLVYLRDFGGDENHHVFAVSRDGGEVRDLTPFPGARAELIDDLEDDPDHLIISMNDRDPTAADVYRLNVRTSERTVIAQNPGTIVQWLSDHEGKLRVAVSTDGVNLTLLYRHNESEPFEELLTTTFRESHTPVAFTFDNKNLYVASNLGRDKEALTIYDPIAKAEVEVIFEHPDVDISGMKYSHYRKVLTEINFVTWRPERMVLDPVWKKLYDSVEAKLPGKLIMVASYDNSERLFTLRATSDRNQGSYYLYDSTSDTLLKLSDMTPWLEEDDLVDVKPISYTSRDGLTIHGYLTLPKGKEPKDLPVVVNPHGGPWARDVWFYNPEVQFFANRGYAVLQMNFRASLGYGRKFWESGFKQWGLTMQDDVTDGVQWLIDQGIADPKRIAIYGASYGGYCTLAGVTFTPDLYACGIDYVGVSNLFTFLNSIPPYWKPMLESMYEMVGHPVRDKAYLESRSPVFHTDKIKAPLLVLQGAKDPRVNIDESNQIVNALKGRGIDVPYIVKENEGHGFSNEENRFEAYEAMEAFLEKHIGH